MRKFIAYVLSVPALVLLVAGLVIMALALGVVGGTKGVSVLTRAMRAFADNLKV
ncbi:hypothetical protein kpv48_27 [Klebsiella phage vB_KpnP_KpV48]|uniref:Uncharacterized protein n=1 Tax=Klebsiella phage vB_KpnP_KpV48 TaxID=1912319 RepID=A0A1I9SEF8_9CAUD|nr:hypothetical protein HOR34_gp27 [Klebsiella phage vB_KpnP_KpV48]AOZ65235.1 hypothetical protein kpv48_27 [Klebsiella phage vB_KpnP_KpV48]